MNKREMQVDCLFLFDDTEPVPFVTFLSKLMAAVPVECWAMSTVEMQPGLEGDSTELAVYFSRPETNDEMEDRLNDEASRGDLEAAGMAIQEQRERDLLERLKAKYEIKS